MIWTDGDYVVSDTEFFEAHGDPQVLGYLPARTFEELAVELGFLARTGSGRPWQPGERKFYRWPSRRMYERGIREGVALTTTAHIEHLLDIPFGTRNLSRATLPYFDITRNILPENTPDDMISDDQIDDDLSIDDDVSDDDAEIGYDEQGRVRIEL